MDDLIKALLEERATHAKFGRRRYVAAVDAELERLGYDTSPLRPKPETTAAAEPPEDTAAPRPERKVDGYACGRCGRSFRTAAALGSHQRSHRR